MLLSKLVILRFFTEEVILRGNDGSTLQRHILHRSHNMHDLTILYYGKTTTMDATEY